MGHLSPFILCPASWISLSNYLSVDCGLTSVEIGDEDSDVGVGEELGCGGDAFVEAPPFVDHDDWVHVRFGLVVLGDVSIDGILGWNGVIFLSYGRDCWCQVGEIQTHPESWTEKKSEHIFISLISVFFYNLLLDKMIFTKVIKAPNAQQCIGSFVACCQ